MNFPVDNYDYPPSWKISRVSDVADFIRGVSWRKADEVPSGEGLLVISIPNIKNGWIDYESEFNHYLGKDVSEEKHLDIGDIVFVGSSGSVHNIGRNAQITSLPSGHVAFASFTFKAVPKLDSVDKEFFYFLVNSDIVPFSRFCKRAADGKFNFQLRDFVSHLKIPIPPLSEQRKIARILSTTRRAIEAQEQIIQTTTELKKALMHKLFTEGTRGEPRKETEIGPIPGNWEVCSIGDAYSFTKKPRTLTLNKHGKYIPFFRMEQIPNGKIYVSEFTKKPVNTLGSGTYVENGDMVIAKITPSFENGKQAIVNIETDFAYATTEVIPLRGIAGESDNFFLFFYLLKPDVRSRLAGEMEGSTGRQRLSKSVLGNRLFPKPPLEEQKEIARIFLTIQQKIEAAESYREALQCLFHSLLHRLMAAEIRVHKVKLLKG